MVFEDPIMTHLTKSKLESEDINCFIYDEHIVSMNRLYNLAVGGIKLKINISDFDKANVVINNVLHYSLTNDQDEVIKYPDCNCKNIAYWYTSIKGLKGAISTLISLVLFVYPFYYKTVNKCKNCGKEF